MFATIETIFPIQYLFLADSCSRLRKMLAKKVIDTIQHPNENMDQEGNVEKNQQQSIMKNQEVEEKQYPPLKARLPAMVAIYLALFLVALVKTAPFSQNDDHQADDVQRIEPSLAQRYPQSPKTSTALTTLRGTKQHSFFHSACSSYLLVEYTDTIQRSRSFSYWSPYSRLDLSSVQQLRPPMPSLSDGRSQVLEAQGSHVALSC